MSDSHDLYDAERVTVGTIGPTGQRVFLLQGRQGSLTVTVKLEKQQVAALSQYLAKVLEELPDPGILPEDLELEEPLDRRKALGMNAHELREVVPHHPQLGQPVDVHRDDHDSCADNPEQLAKSSLGICPVMDGQHGQPRINGGIGQRKVLGLRPDHRRRARRALGDHHLGGLDRQDPSVAWLVRPGARPYVDDGGGVSQRLRDRLFEAGIGSANQLVSPAHHVVRGLAHACGCEGSVDWVAEWLAVGSAPARRPPR